MCVICSNSHLHHMCKKVHFLFTGILNTIHDRQTTDSGFPEWAMLRSLHKCRALIQQSLFAFCVSSGNDLYQLESTVYGIWLSGASVRLNLIRLKT
jgi:hypothetical protein